jgi:hypothetical protein
MGGMKRLWHRFNENIPDLLFCFSHLFLLAWLLATFVAGGYLVIYLMKALVPRIGISNFVVVLSAVTAALAALFLIDLGKLSATYKRWSRDGWFGFVQVVVLGFTFAVANMWLTLFRKGALPIEYLLILLILAPVYAWLVSRKRRKGKRFLDIDALLKKKD